MDRIRYYWNRHPIVMPVSIALVGSLPFGFIIKTIMPGYPAHVNIYANVEDFLVGLIFKLAQSCLIIVLARWLGGRGPWSDSLPAVFMMLVLFSLPGAVVGWPAAFPLQIVGGMIAVRLFQKLSWVKSFVCGFTAFFATIALLYTLAIIRAGRH